MFGLAEPAAGSFHYDLMPLSPYLLHKDELSIGDSLLYLKNFYVST
jgi:hypothetical protein